MHCFSEITVITVLTAEKNTGDYPTGRPDLFRIKIWAFLKRSHHF